jgi:hypothetical protein
MPARGCSERRLWEWIIWKQRLAEHLTAPYFAGYGDSPPGVPPRLRGGTPFSLD